jgi:hypothetical protein
MYIYKPNYTVAIFKYFTHILFLRIAFWIRESKRLVAAIFNPKASGQVCCGTECIRSPYLTPSLYPVYHMMDKAQNVSHKNVEHLSTKT